jgi:GDP-D-mannose dehydratase
MGMKKAIITGITGQDGAYLAQLLLEKAMRFMGLSGDRAAQISGEFRSWTFMAIPRFISWNTT